MVNQHLLIQKAFKHKRTKINLPSQYIYHSITGAWIEKDGKFLIKSSNYKKYNIGTKKEDIETGEDLKGE